MEHWCRLTQGYLGSDSPLSGPAMVASLVCLLWIGGALAWLARSLLRRVHAKARFRAFAAERGFDPEETGDLWRLSRHADAFDRAAVLTAPEAFDACVAEARKAAGDDLVAWPEYLAASRVRSLRRNFEKARKPRHNITHTREIEPNQPVKVRLAEAEAFDSFILRATEDELHLALPREVVIVGPPAERAPFEREINKRYLPAVLLAPADAGDGLPVLEGRSAGTGATAYVCENMVCDLPATSVSAFVEQLER